MKKIIYLLIGCVLLVTSCTMTSRVSPMTQVNVQINFDMDDMEYIGDVTGSAEQHYYLTMPYGGRKYYSGQIYMPGQFNLVGSDRAVQNALYDALLSKPDADFIMPLSFEIKEQKVFLGSLKKITVRGKAFKIKTK